jgi:hypothetical protein
VSQVQHCSKPGQHFSNTFADSASPWVRGEWLFP